MKTSYIDLIDQTFYFPQEEFDLDGDNLTFHGIDLMGLIEKYGTPLRLTYLPRISENIQRAKRIFAQAMQKNDYHASYNYCYCTKSSHYSFILHEALKNDIHIETSSAYDIPIVEKLIAEGRLAKDSYILCNGFKRGKYIDYIARLINTGHPNTIPIIDNEDEIDYLCQAIDRPFEIGIRIASEEEPKFTFYTSRLGIKYRDIAPLYRRVIKNHPKVRLKMLHFFINTGIKDSAYYWNELLKCLKVYADLKKDCPELDSLNIGGGFPIK
ncbi:MAG TPA: arginine decarboxylase, partial [Candidatus Merdimorpha stercoravium]|nr:arginine decarboxylase [Candidatus Merdimorpha stercoravium]